MTKTFLMAVASIGAFVIGEYPEAVAVMLFYQIGELFEDYAVGKSRRSITELMQIRPDYANLKLADGNIKKVDPNEVKIGDLIVIKPGEKGSAGRHCARGLIHAGYRGADRRVRSAR